MSLINPNKKNANRYIKLGLCASVLLGLYYFEIALRWDKATTEQQYFWGIFGLIYLWIAWGYYLKSKGMSVFAIAFFIIEKHLWWRSKFDGFYLPSKHYTDLTVDILFLLALLVGTQGSLVYHKIMRSEKAQPNA